MNDVPDFRSLVRDVPDWPKPGVTFKDITPLLADPDGLAWALEAIKAPFGDAGIDLVAGIESRGFIFGLGVARALGAGFVPVRKPGKLPGRTLREDYALEYGTDAVEIHADAVAQGQRVLLVDDVLATGGTLAASCDLFSRAGIDVVGAAVLIELSFLEGAARIGPPLHSVWTY
jgi:adenine phosphoribosyltransferase